MNKKKKPIQSLITFKKPLTFRQAEKKRAADLILANKELVFQNTEKEMRAAELIIANQELAFQNEEKEKRAAELVIANKELAFQNKEKEKRAAELIIANKELAYQNEEKEKRSAELIIANRELAFQNKEKEKRTVELFIANHKLDFQNKEIENGDAELIVVNHELDYQNGEKEKRAAELIVANKELAYQNEEKEKRAAELIIANKELVFQNEEKENRAARLVIANEELAYQNKEKEKRAAELIIANQELAFQNEEKEKRAAELIVANKELAYQNKEKEKRAAELVRANHEHQRAEEQFRLVVESAPYAMVLVDQEGYIALVNNQTEKLFGYERKELIGKKLEILIPTRFDKHSQHRDMFTKDPKSRTMGAGRNLFALLKNGSEIQVEIALNPIETAKGHKVLATIIDITERKLQEVKLKKYNKDLEQMVYVASHDLQEPLRTVSNYMQVFEEDYTTHLDENGRKYLSSVNKATIRMSNVVKSLLDFSRLGYDKKLTSIDIKTLLDEVIADLETIIKTNHARIEVGDMPTLNIYETEMRQVFQNLITNAIKFRKNDMHPNIKISAEKTHEVWKFSISDNGIGIAPVHYDRIFQIFQRLHSHERYEGNGIGLANCKKLVQLHQGEIWVDSVLEQGSTFNFTIPSGIA